MNAVLIRILKSMVLRASRKQPSIGFGGFVEQHNRRCGFVSG
ncbi:hypothetical protein R2A130_1097 [Ahrensia sp. R2A130]|nr:hypothetical protein R2A130_1097 [Ahrensia sp. R2A130]